RGQSRSLTFNGKVTLSAGSFLGRHDVVIAINLSELARMAGSLYVEFGSFETRYGIGGPRGESACSLRTRSCAVERFPRLDCQCRRVSKTSSLQHKVGRQAWKVRGTGVHFNHYQEG